MNAKRWLLWVGTVIVPWALALSTGCGGDNDPESLSNTLNVALLPDESPATIIRRNKPLKNYLESALKRDIKLIVTTDYSSMIEAMRRGQIDVGYFGPLSYILLKERMPGATPFAAKIEGGKPTYRAVLITAADSGIERIEDLKGKIVAFGDPASTSSHLIPRTLILKRGGLRAGKDYEPVFVGAHDAVALNVQNGNAQAGGLSKTIFEALCEQGTINRQKIKVLAESDPCPNYPWVFRSDLEPELQSEISRALFDLRKRDILEPLKAEGFAPIADGDYDVVREMVKILGINPERPQ
jgi:phosphonate transport system substrate-binding protein